MMPRKKRITVAVLMVIILIVLTATIFILLYLNTDMFRSNQTLFFKYLGKNTENIEEIQKSMEQTEFEKQLQSNPYEETTEIKVNYTENTGTTLENTNNNINQLKVDIEGKVDKQNRYDYKDIKLVRENETLLETEYIQSDDLYGIRFSDLFRQFIMVQNSNLKDLLGKVGYTEEQLQDFPDSITLDEDIVSSFSFSDEEIEQLKEKYFAFIGQGVEKANYEKQKNQTITINKNNIMTNAYTLKLTKEQLNDMYLKILENLKQDELILSKIENLQNNMNVLPLFFSNNPSLKQRILNKIDETIEKINQNNIGTEETKIAVYESQGETVRTAIQGVDYEITMDFLTVGDEQFAELSMTKNEQMEKVTFRKKSQELAVTMQENENDLQTIITLEENKKQTDQSETKNIMIRYEKQDDKVEINCTQDRKLVQQIEEKITLDNQNSVELNPLEQPQVQAILNRVKEGINRKLEEQEEKIKIKEIQQVLEMMGLLKDEQKLEGTVISETEKNRFNSKYELLQGEEMSSEEVVKVVETIQNNLINMEVVSNKELKLEINRNQKKEELLETLITFLEKDKNRKYNIKVEYNPDGLVQYVVLTIVDKK